MQGDPRGVFYDLHDDARAADLTARSELMRAIDERIRAAGWTQAEAAQRLGLTEARVSDLIEGKLSEFSLDALAKIRSQVLF